MARLSDICLKIGSGATPTGGKSAYLMKGISLIRSQNVLDISFADDGLAYISDEQARKLQNVEILEGDILLNITGDSVARVCIVPNHILPARVNQHVAIIRVDKTKADNNYILYSLIKSKKTLLALASAGSTRNALTKKMIEEFEVFLPSLAEQKRIASILSSLDDKIAVNRRINANLEAQAEALFKSWFVDFTPFKDQPFVDSELGPIPQGWKVGKLGDIALQSTEKVLTRNDVKVLSPITTGKLVLSEEYFTKQVFSKSIRNYKIVKQGAFAYNPARVNIGSLGMNEFKFDGCVSPVYVVFECLKGYSFFFDLFRKTEFFKQAVISFAIGGVRQTLNYSDFALIDATIPPLNIVQSFNEIYLHLKKKISINEEENLRLAALRDTLLPKLMSGEIKL